MPGDLDALLRLLILQELLTEGSAEEKTAQKSQGSEEQRVLVEALAKQALGTANHKKGASGERSSGQPRPDRLALARDPSQAWLAVTEAEILARAQEEFAKELSQNLQRLKEVIQESQSLAEKMEAVLGQRSQTQSGGSK